MEALGCKDASWMILKGEKEKIEIYSHHIIRIRSHSPFVQPLIIFRHYQLVITLIYLLFISV